MVRFTGYKWERKETEGLYRTANQKVLMGSCDEPGTRADRKDL